ncbi:MAG: hypothetical protein HC794_00990 [Nitrospiraceae bacterium]|nr:hypothetical protein [Nitrospiraceae bacterium]
MRTCLVRLLAESQGGPVSVQVSPAEHRAHAIFSRVAELDNCLRSLRIAVAGLQAEATSTSPIVEQYRYQVENYLLRLTGLFDRACRFGGVAIGMSSSQVDKQAGNSAVLKKLKSSGAVSAVERLDELRALLEPHWDNRNVVAHAGEFSSRELGLFVSVAQVKLESVSLEDLRTLMAAHFRDGALDFGLLALQAEGLLYRLIVDLAPRIAAPVMRGDDPSAAHLELR